MCVKKFGNLFNCIIGMSFNSKIMSRSSLIFDVDLSIYV